MATVARPRSAFMRNMRPSSISFRNSSSSTRQALSVSQSCTPILVLFSDEACDTMKTEMPCWAKEVKMRWFTPITPTMDRPLTVMRLVPLMEDMPLMLLCSSSCTFCLTMVP